MRSVALLAALMLAAGCGEQRAAATAEVDRVIYATTYPLLYMTGRIAGDAVDVECPLPDGEDPEFFQPSRRALETMQSAALIVTNGADYERWLQRVSLPESRIVDTSAGLKDRLLTIETTTHSHGAGGEHTHEGLDGHVWIDPVQAAEQARAIHAAASRRFPEHAAAFGENLAALVTDLDDLAARLRRLAEPARSVELFSAHETFGYLGRRLGVEIRDLELSPDAPPDENKLRELRGLPQSGKRRVLLWDAQPKPEVTRVLAESFGFHSVVFDPCADMPAGDADYMTVMRRNLDALGQAIAGN